MTFANRKIGLGIMGFADFLIQLGIPYTSEKAVETAEELMSFFHQESLQASAALAEERGVFPNFDRSDHAKTKDHRLRNATVNTVAPTGTISIVAGCSSGIEPLFALSFVRNVLSGTKLFEIHPHFERELHKRGLYSRELMAKIGQQGSLRDIDELPAELKDVFVTSFDVLPEQHLKIQAAFQRHTDNSVSKTINLPSDATVEDVRNVYLLAHELKCKGITIYRYGTKREQVLSFDSRSGKERREEMGFISAAAEFSGGCPSGLCPF